MKGDFSKDSFNQSKHYRTVRLQQGRVQVDADWNEQMDIFNHQLRSQFTDLIGDAATPVGGDGFKISLVESVPQNLLIAQGRYYIAGWLAEKDSEELITAQADLPDSELPNEEGLYLLYLDAWQRHLSASEETALKESALVGVDTTTRIKQMAQVKWLRLGDLDIVVDKDTLAENETWQTATAASSGQLTVRLRDHDQLGNHFYRIEIHQHGDFADDAVTFKWSHDNGSVVRRIEKVEALSIELESVSLAQQSQLGVGDWVELSHEGLALYNQPGSFVQLTEVNDNQLKIASWPAELNADDFVGGTVRRWERAPLSVSTGSLEAQYSTINEINGDRVILDLQAEDIEALFSEGQLVELSTQTLIDNQRPGLLARIESINGETNSLIIPGVSDFDIAAEFIRPEGESLATSDGYIALGNGIEVKFDEGDYRVGDYWTFASRAAANSIDWPLDPDKAPQTQPPFGIRHEYAPLALLRIQADGRWTVEDYRTLFATSASNPVASEADEAVIFIDENKHVGIGTPSPGVELSVIGNVRGANDTTETEYTEIGHNGLEGYINTVGDGNLEFQHDGNTLMSVQDGGNVGIGTSAPTEKLDVNGVVKASKFDGFGIVPIGTIQAWHKGLAGVPALPEGWVECDGQTLSDVESPLDGSQIPNLNGDSRFLRGSDHSGDLQGDEFRSHAHSGVMKTPPSGTPAVYGAQIYESGHAHHGTGNNISTGTDAAGGPETRPKNMSVVYIIRVK
ncbi:MAG: DUF6519 domain-containing protein [Pseudomonadales bacterium]